MALTSTTYLELQTESILVVQSIEPCREAFCTFSLRACGSSADTAPSLRESVRKKVDFTEYGWVFTVSSFHAILIAKNVANFKAMC